jgi:D-alanyl-D-alanine carboxypeptidase
VATAIALAAMLCAPAAAASAGLAERVKAAVRPLGRGASVQVTDLATRRTVVAVRARRSRPLGSTAKLLTAAAALRRLGPTRRSAPARSRRRRSTRTACSWAT